MLEVLREAGGSTFKRAVAGVLSSPALRWTWNETRDRQFPVSLGDFRPADTDTVTDMAAGRYLLGGKLVDTNGVSPFATRVEHYGWRSELHGFSWLRHFSDCRTADCAALRARWCSTGSDASARSYDAEIWSTST